MIKPVYSSKSKGIPPISPHYGVIHENGREEVVYDDCDEWNEPIEWVDEREYHEMWLDQWEDQWEND